MSSLVAFIIMVLVADVDASTTFLAASLTELLSMLWYKKLTSFSFLMAALTLGILTRLRQMVLNFVGCPFKMMYSSGVGGTMVSSAVRLLIVTRVLVSGRGRKNIVPLHALRELYKGTVLV